MCLLQANQWAEMRPTGTEQQEKEVTKLVEEWGKRIGIEPSNILEIKGREVSGK